MERKQIKLLRLYERIRPHDRFFRNFDENRWSEFTNKLKSVTLEVCYNILVEVESDAAADAAASVRHDDLGDLSVEDGEKLIWILSQGQNKRINFKSAFETSKKDDETVTVFEFGSKLNFQTAFSTNAVAIFHTVGLQQIVRCERSNRYQFEWNPLDPASENYSKPEDRDIPILVWLKLFDSMTECVYTKQLLDSYCDILQDQSQYDFEIVPLEFDPNTNECRSLIDFNRTYGLSWDQDDVNYLTNLFKDVLKRDPTNIELFDLAQSNSEHSRHWFFKGLLNINGKNMKESLMEMVMKTQNYSNNNNVIKFSDNSSAIEGFVVDYMWPKQTGVMSLMSVESRELCFTLTAETHNFPTGVAPFSGAATGVGGRIRDNLAVGRGGLCLGAMAGYCVGNLNIEGYVQKWEENLVYPNQFEKPKNILVEASNGASDYGNKYGEPLVAGFTRSFGLLIGEEENQERREWIKPIMFSAGIGYMDLKQTKKLTPKLNLEIAKIGGPVYRIGIGGGSASSAIVQGDVELAERDLNAVQRGDPEMEQKLSRVIRACVESGHLINPIYSIHDQGAGGNGNVLKELVNPVGGVVYASEFDYGDPTVSVFELWVSEYQESNAILIHKDSCPTVRELCRRERCPVSFVGEIRESGSMQVFMQKPKGDNVNNEPVFDLPLEHVFGNVPQKIFKFERRLEKKRTKLMEDPTFLSTMKSLTVYEAVEMVLRLVSVGSKRFLTNKVDRSVTGLVVQQQCVGPFQVPIADAAVLAISYFDDEKGVASSIGEQPIKCLVDSKVGARMTVIEALTNLVFVPFTELRDIKCSANWMWPAKLDDEGCRLYDACESMCEVMKKLGIAVDGGKDSLSMAAQVGDRVVKAPGSLVVSTYVPCTNIKQVVTPDFKEPLAGREGVIMFIDLSSVDRPRLGGSALLQCLKQIGDQVPDIDDIDLFKRTLETVQVLVKRGLIRAGHDISDGGFIVCLLEMCFGGFCGAQVNLKHRNGNPLEILFAEEVGLLIEVAPSDAEECRRQFRAERIPFYTIGKSKAIGPTALISIQTKGFLVYETRMLDAWMAWEETSSRLEAMHIGKYHASAAYDNWRGCTQPPVYKVTFGTLVCEYLSIKKPVVAIVREEGTNGDRELAAAFFKENFSVCDVTMQDIIEGKVTLDMFRGLAFPGGFSYADVFGSGKGWAANIRFNEQIREQFDQFYRRPDTFSLGICNGCQLLTLIDWVLPNVRLKQNVTKRFESRWLTVKIAKTNSIFFQDMEDSVLGVWVAHGEGQFYSNASKKANIDSAHVPVHYVDLNGNPTECYPMNPNGSVDGVAAVSSADGRHLAMMPHPERSVEYYQWPWIPEYINQRISCPWRRMFQNVYNWCVRPTSDTIS